MNATAPEEKAERRRIRFPYFGVVFLAFLAASILIGLRLLYGTVADTEGRFIVEGLDGEITIAFDDRERPYVSAATFDDALFAQGWLHASHRLWQMELLRSAGKGRLAAFLGSGMLNTDKELWRRGVPQLADALAANASPWLHGKIERYVAGINAAREAGQARPLEFLLLRHAPEPWTPRDVYALGALMAYQTANNAENELLRLAILHDTDPERTSVFLPDEDLDPDFPYVIPDRGTADLVAALERGAALDPATVPLMPSIGFGSNGWVVAPGRSASGNALFAFDSHDSLALPNLFYEIHLFFGAGEQVRGWSVPGLPGVINGYNERIAWGFTTIGDSQDLFIEERSPDEDLLFRSGDEWYRAEIETVAIPVKGRDEPEPFTIVRTRNGPLLSEEPPIALRWAVQDLGDTGMDSILRLNRALDWDAFTEALDGFPGPALNATYADIDGNIGLRTAGLLPVRGRGDGLTPMPGYDPAAQWRGMIPPDELPAYYNPPEGFIAAANARLQPPGAGPLVSADNAPGYRVRRLRSVLGASKDFTADAMAALQRDWYDGQAALLLPDLLDALGRADLGEREEAARDLLAEWMPEPIATPDSAAALIFQAWYRHLAYEVFRPGLGEATFDHLIRSTYPLNHALDTLIRFDHRNGWWRGDRDGLIADALQQALDEIEATLGPEPARWELGAMHRVVLNHELGAAVPLLGRLFNARPEPWGGSPATIGRARYRLDRAHDVNSAATVRFVAEMAPDGIRAAGILPAGQSGHPLSKHYLDQFPDWLAGNLTPIPPTPDTIPGPHLTLTPPQ